MLGHHGCGSGLRHANDRVQYVRPGTVAVAAALTGKLRPFGQRVGIIISGGNVAPETYATILAQGA